MQRSSRKKDKEQLLDLMSQLGDFHRYQVLQHCLHALAWFMAAVHMMSFVFVFPVLEHRCYVDEIDQSNRFYNGSLATEPEIERYIPKNAKGHLESCMKYGNTNTTIQSCTDGFVYSSQHFTSSRTNEFNMVCENEWMRALLQSIFLFGTLTGAFLCGYLADKHGRKPIFVISGILQCVFGVVVAFMNNYVLMAISMYFYGLFGGSGSVVPSVALTMEVVGPKQRSLCGTLFTVWFSFGGLLVAGLSRFLPFNAQQLQLIFALLPILLFAHYWLMDESICWLWTNGQKAKAIEIAENAVKFNGGKFVNRYNPTTVDKSSSPRRKGRHGIDPKSPSTLDLFRSPVLRRRTMVMLYCWFASNLTYFGLSFNSVNLLGDPHLMFVISLIAEFPGHFISIFLVHKTGNKPLFSFSLLFTGVSCTVVGLLPGGPIPNTIAMLAKVTATIAFNIINSYTAELFPTSHRNTAVGLCVMAARTGAAIIPEIDLLSHTAEEIPIITFGLFGILAGLFAFFLLPETMDQEIPQTVADVERLGLSTIRKSTKPKVEVPVVVIEAPTPPASETQTQKVKAEAPTVEAETPTVEAEAKTVDAESPTVEVETPTVEAHAKTVEADGKTVESETPTVEAETPTVEAHAKTVEADGKTVESETPTVEADAKSVEAETPTVEAEAKTAEAEAKTVEVETPTVEAETPTFEAETPTVEAEAKTVEAEGTSTCE